MEWHSAYRLHGRLFLMFYGELPFGKRYGSAVKSFCYCYCASVCVRPWLLFGWTTKWDTSHASPRGWCFILVSNLAMREQLSASVLNAERQKWGFSNDFRKCSLCLHQVNKRRVERSNLFPSCREATLSLSHFVPWGLSCLFVQPASSNLTKA